MKLLKSKTDERLEIENQVQFFLAKGGKINAVASGISGRDIGAKALPPVSFQHQNKEPRTLLLEQVKAIEARKHKPVKTVIRKSKPRRVLIKDDFGEPLRWSWEDSQSKKDH